MPVPSPDRCHACGQPLLFGRLDGRVISGCAACNVFTIDDGLPVALDETALRALLRQRTSPDDAV